METIQLAAALIYARSSQRCPRTYTEHSITCIGYGGGHQVCPGGATRVVRDAIQNIY